MISVESYGYQVTIYKELILEVEYVMTLGD